MGRAMPFHLGQRLLSETSGGPRLSYSMPALSDAACAPTPGRRFNLWPAWFAGFGDMRTHLGRDRFPCRNDARHPQEAWPTLQRIRIRGDELRALGKLQKDQEPKSAFVFTSERGGAPFTRDSFNWMVERAGKKAGLPFQVHAHMIRHATGYKLANGRKGHKVDPGLPRSQGYKARLDSPTPCASISATTRRAR